MFHILTCLDAKCDKNSQNVTEITSRSIMCWYCLKGDYTYIMYIVNEKNWSNASKIR